jgi:hypothetical protein
VTAATGMTVTKIAVVTVTREVAVTAPAVVTVIVGLNVIVDIVHHILLQSILLFVN